MTRRHRHHLLAVLVAVAGLVVGLAAPSAADGASAVRDHFAAMGAPRITGSPGCVAEPRPVIVDGAWIGGCKYAVDIRPEGSPAEAAVVDTTIAGNPETGSSKYAASILIRQYSGIPTGTVAYIFGSTLNAAFPPWVDYSTTNYDGITADANGSGSALYVLDTTISGWSDAAIDAKSWHTQYVNLSVTAPNSGSPGHRALRFWAGGSDHWLVDSDIAGSWHLIWVRGTHASGPCSTFTLNVWRSTFDGQTRVPPGRAVCEDGQPPNIVYHDEPLHPFLRAA